MNLIKIGKFIAYLRKEKNLTQEELAEKLYITNRAVSKWERGISLPDVDKMLDLCNILDININELLTGERINMKDYNDKTEKLLLDLAKLEEVKNKKLLNNMWILLITVFIFYTSILLLACYTLKEGLLLGIIISLSTIFSLIICFYSLKLEVDAGYYECKKCHHIFTISYFKALMAPHLATTRFVKCPKCNKHIWAKKVMTKNENNK